MVRIAQIATPQDCAEVKALVLEYVVWAGTQDPDAEAAATFSNLAAELDGLLGIYGPPTGSFLLATDGDVPEGCVAFREKVADTVELKRMNVRPGQRGKGTGLALVQDLISVARAQGRKRVVLDSYHTMTGAHKIYRAVGFGDVAAPDDLSKLWHGRILFMEMDL